MTSLVTAAFPIEGVSAHDGLLDDLSGSSEAVGQEAEAKEPGLGVQEVVTDSGEIEPTAVIDAEEEPAEETAALEADFITEAQIDTELDAELETVLDTELEIIPETEFVPEIETETENPDFVSKCNHLHDAVCGYIEAIPEVSCDMKCKDTDGDSIVKHCLKCAYQPEVEGEICTHVHDAQCGYYDADESEVKTETETETQNNTEVEIETDIDIDTEINTDIVTEVGTETMTVSDPETEIESEIKSGTENGIVDDSDAAGAKESDTELQSQSAKETDTELESQSTEAEKDKKTDRETAFAKSTESEIQKETDNLGTNEYTTETVEKIETKDLAGRTNAPSFTVSIPAEVMINANTDFEIETAYISSEKAEEEGETAYLVVDGDKKKCLDDFFVLTREGDDNTTWQYQLYIEDTLITGTNNKVVLNSNKTVQKATIHPVEQQAVLPAGSYKGTLNFRIICEDEKTAGTLNK